MLFMKKLLPILIIAALVGGAHSGLLAYAETYAKERAPRYVEPTVAEIGPAPSPAGPSDSMYDRRMAELAENIYDAEKGLHYSKYFRKHIEPRQKEFETWTNRSFIVVYVLLSALFVWALYRTLADNANRIKRGAHYAFVRLPARAFRESRLAKLGQRHRLKVAAKEFETAKSLYENGLLSAEEFERRKNSIRQTLNAAG